MVTSIEASSSFDVILVGGGLANGLIALALFEQRPGIRIAMIERSPRVGGNHTWSFHAGDVPALARPVVEPLVVRRWSSYDVAFPRLERKLAMPYASVTSERFATVLEQRFRRALGSALLTSASVDSVDATSVSLADGRMLSAKLVVDSRGPMQARLERIAGYQKFVGLELELDAGHDQAAPLLMDARVEQTDGFRFFYVLPYDARRVLVEDTYFSDTEDLDREALREGILAYARKRGMSVRAILRSETGVLPMPARGLPQDDSNAPLTAGYAGGWFHPATAYSFPIAVRLALHLAKAWESPFDAAWAELVAEHRRQFRFATLLNRMLFGAFRPETRFNALERFYRLPEDTIRRFYALETTPRDRLRIICGRPPRGMSLRRAA